jgi:integrase
MASVFKSPGKSKYTILYTDEHGDRRKKVGYTDKSRSERFANKLEERAREIRDGLADPKAVAYRDHATRPLAEHLEAWKDDLSAKGRTPKHVELFCGRAMRVVALVKGRSLSEIDTSNNARRTEGKAAARALAEACKSARLDDLTEESVQRALATLKDAGRSLATCNHHRVAIKSFSIWCHGTHRIREDQLRRVTGFDATTDLRHDRRTLSLDELQKLITITEHGPDVWGLAGEIRALCYRLAVATGLRYSEIAEIRPESFDWEAPSVTVIGRYTKNGQTATQTLPPDVVPDLAALVATRATGEPIFGLPPNRGASILRVDLAAAGISYRDASDKVFDFHALRCQTATLLDAAGVSPRKVQEIMRHSKLELTGRYTRSRDVDIQAAARLMPSLKPENDRPEALAMTGTDPGPIRTATKFATPTSDDARKVLSLEDVRANERRMSHP